MKLKIIERIKAKFTGVNLSKARLDEIAAKLEGKISEESEIDSKLDDLNEMFPFADIAKQDDRLRDLEAKVKKPATKPNEPKNEPEPAHSPTDDEPEYVKTLMATVKALSDQVSAINQGKLVTDRRTQLTAALKGADEVYRNKALKNFDRMTFADDEAFNTYLTEEQEDFKAFNQSQIDAGLGKDKPRVAFGSATLKDDEISPMMKQHLENQKAEQEKAAK